MVLNFSMVDLARNSVTLRTDSLRDEFMFWKIIIYEASINNIECKHLRLSINVNVIR